MNEETQRLDHAARLLRMFGQVHVAYRQTGWLAVGLMLSSVDPEEIREVADWVADFAKNRSGTDSARGHETDGRGTDGIPVSSERPPSPSALVTTPNDPLVAGSSAPYDWETEGLGGT